MICLPKFFRLPYHWFRQNVDNVLLIMLMVKKLNLHLYQESVILM